MILGNGGKKKKEKKLFDEVHLFKTQYTSET